VDEFFRFEVTDGRWHRVGWSSANERGGRTARVCARRFQAGTPDSSRREARSIGSRSFARRIEDSLSSNRGGNLDL
jgi:hypothetical protein